MGAIAKKMIGIAATAAAATIVTMFMAEAKAESTTRDDKTNVAAKSRTPMAEASAMINRTSLPRRRRNNREFPF